MNLYFNVHIYIYICSLLRLKILPKYKNRFDNIAVCCKKLFDGRKMNVSNRNQKIVQLLNTREKLKIKYTQIHSINCSAFRTHVWPCI